MQRIVDLLVAQGKPLLAQDDTWRAFTLLRNTAALLPQTGKGQSRAALLDAQGVSGEVGPFATAYRRAGFGRADQWPLAAHDE